MIHDFPTDNPIPLSEGLLDLEPEAFTVQDTAPSAPIILLSAAFGLICGMIGLFLMYAVNGYTLELSIGVGLICLSIGLIFSSVGLTTLAGSSALVSNLAFGCGVIVISVMFFALCTLSGALAATLIILSTT
ncbi:MAG: hypothetical protein AAF702_31405 [Chloroflexota bacterium]